ncbi:MAG: hypothetical protein ONB06_09260, partial [candidate division KSB1 bacterium]|nr:hypothetical protein [candidate division KSB1 bacterium]
VAHHVQMVQLDSLQAQRGEVARRGQDVGWGLAREAEDDMGTEPQLALPGAPHGIVEGRDRMAAVEEGESPIVPRFQA